MFAKARIYYICIYLYYMYLLYIYLFIYVSYTHTLNRSILLAYFCQHFQNVVPGTGTHRAGPALAPSYFR